MGYFILGVLGAKKEGFKIGTVIKRQTFGLGTTDEQDT